MPPVIMLSRGESNFPRSPGLNENYTDSNRMLAAPGVTPLSIPVLSVPCCNISNSLIMHGSVKGNERYLDKT